MYNVFNELNLVFVALFEGVMRFMIVEKTRLTFPALISKVFKSESEAKRYGFKKPGKAQAQVIKVENGFELTEKTSKYKVPLEKVPENTKKIECGRVTLFLKDLHKYCRVVVF